MITVQDLTVRYGADLSSSVALDHVSLSVPQGTTCAVIGPSGCGKSTLLRVLAGIAHDYEGRVQINGQPIQPAVQRIGFMPQNYGLLPWRTVRENIRLGLKIRKAVNAGTSQRIVRLMERLGIEGLDMRYPHELSGGQQQRVGLARAFALRPDILLMDEPFSALDAITREEMQDVFLGLWRESAVSTVLVTHYVEEAVYLGQQIVILSDHPGKVREIIHNPLFGGRDIRQQCEFFAMGLRLRHLLKKDGN